MGREPNGYPAAESDAAVRTLLGDREQQACTHLAG